MDGTTVDRQSDWLIIVGVACFAVILIYGLLAGEFLLALVVVLLLIVIRALYKILGVLHRLEITFVHD